jgi:putative MATE family efflux protein
MNNSLAKKFTISSLMLFALPNIVMMIFLSLYVIVDGMFISRYVGTTALSAVNMVYPAISIEMAISIMLSSGASAIIAKKLGEGEEDKAKAFFTFITLIVAGIGLSIAILGAVFVDGIIIALGASQSQLELCKNYGQILFVFAPFFFLQTAFQTLFITAGKPNLGLITTVCAGITNIVLDYIFLKIFGMGIKGAAVATGISCMIPAIVGIVFFASNKKGSLYFVKPKFDGKMLVLSCTNGSSEMVSNIANAVTTFLFNYTFLHFYGEDGVASISIVLYFQFVFSAIYFGYSMGVAPIISFKYGCDDEEQLKNIFKNSMVFLIISSIASFILSRVLIRFAMTLFTEYGSTVFNITLKGFPLFSIGFLFMGISIFASAMFTAFSDGKTSAIISSARTFIFLVAAILIFPILLGEKGIWISVPVAEALGLTVSAIYLLRKKSKYKY